MTFVDYIIYIFNLGVAMGAVLAFIMIAYGGFNLLSSGDNPSAKGEAKKKIINALLGLAILLVSYLLLTTINPDLVELKGVSLGSVNISIPVLSPETNQVSLEEYSFEEVPIGTLTENILAGTSSNSNGMPCYEYEHKAYDSGGNMIIANTVDRNGDGEIDENDTLLDKDPFYCIKLLDDAIKQKTEVHLNYLINELEEAMRSCKCSRCHYGHLPIEEEPGDCVSVTRLPGFVYPAQSGCSFCDYPVSFCKSCGSAHIGCEDDPEDEYDETIYEQYDGFEQYGHDPCPNRLEIDCKRQAIMQLIDGTEPDEVCYKEVDGEAFLKREPFNLFTIADGLERLGEFKAYFEDSVIELSRAELETKEPWGERLTLAEFNTIEAGDDKRIITKEEYGEYDISRYCSDYNCSKKEEVGGEDVCVEWSLTDEKRVCKIDEEEDDKEYYFYDGDPLTFYFNSSYNKDTASSANKKKCSVVETDPASGSYSGVIPIGETVDASEVWGNEVAYRIGKLMDEVQGISSVGMEIYEVPNECDCGNCKSGTEFRRLYCFKPCCSDGGCGDCYCAPYMCFSCMIDEPIERKKDSEGIPLENLIVDPCYSFSYCDSIDPPPTIDIGVPQDDWWVCPYNKFCDLTKKLYQRRLIQDSCYEDTDNKAEKTRRTSNLGQVGYVQKFEEREEILFELAGVKEIEDDKKYASVDTTDLIENICPEYKRNTGNSTLVCNASLSTEREVEDRFDLLEMLSYSRVKITGCVQGYSFPYKENLVQSKVFNCSEALDLIVLDNVAIEFPGLNNEEDKYWDCYPYNSPDLTEEARYSCYTNKDKDGTAENPGCKLLTLDYMDNYYCCE